jgi:hypothetical protein
MSTNTVVKPPLNSASTPSTLTPDVWVAATAAAAQTYVNAGKTTVPTSVAALSSAVSKAQSQNAISQPVATSIQGLLQTPAGATLVANSIVLANRAFAYITTRASAPASPPPAEPASTVAVASGTAAHEAAASTGAQASPSMTMTGQQVVAIVESTNYVLGKLGKPAIPTARGVVRTADAPAGSGSGSGSGGNSDPGVQSSSTGNFILGAAVGVVAAGVQIIGDTIPGAIAAAAVAEAAISGVEFLIDNYTDDVPVAPPSDGMGSGSYAWPGSIDDGDSSGEGSDTGEGIDDKPGLQVQ